MTDRIRKSVPTQGVSSWWGAGWMYVMPDFENKDHSIIEWSYDTAPVEPEISSQSIHRVPVKSCEREIHERTQSEA